MAFLPGWDFSSLGEIQDGQGYHIKTTQSCAFTVEGSYLLPEENPINLNDGWNLIGYLREEPADIAAILYAIIDDIVIAKDYLGNVYLPEWEFNGIGEMTPGSAYIIKTTQATILEYKANDISY